MGWGWFWPDSDVHNDPLMIGRSYARIMGHTSHGLIFWIYSPDKWQGKTLWRGKLATRAAVAHWHDVYQKHWEFLRRAAAVKADVAVVRSRNTGSMYKGFDYPKLDFGWTCAALSEMHVPFEVVTSNQVEIEPEVLTDYKVLFVPTATWESGRFRKSISGFIASGGYVFTDGDSFMLDAADGRKTGFLARHFGVRPLKKYKGLFHVTYDSTEEYEWVKKHVGAIETPGPYGHPKWVGDALRLPPGKSIEPLMVTEAELSRLRSSLPKTSGTGLSQRLWDVNVPQIIIARVPWLRGTDVYRTFHDVVTGQATAAGRVLATYGSEVAAVETERTVWTGFRPGFDHACLFPARWMGLSGEPIWPFDVNRATTAEQRSGPRRYLRRILDKAGVKPIVAVRCGGIAAPNIEVLVRRDVKGNAMVFLVNHESRGAEYELAAEFLSDAEAVCELRTGQAPSKSRDGRFRLPIAAEDVSILVAGSRGFVARRLSSQKKVKLPQDVKPIQWPALE